LILNTSEYCTNTTTQLEEKIQEIVDQEFKPQISLSRENECFMNVSGVGLSGLVKYVEYQLEPCLTMMIRHSWNTVQAVGDQSDFINQIGTNIAIMMVPIKKYLTSARFFKSFCDKFAEYITILLNLDHSRANSTLISTDVGQSRPLELNRYRTRAKRELL
jgi:hypothetical protein